MAATASPEESVFVPSWSEREKGFHHRSFGSPEKVKASGVVIDWEEVDAGSDNELSRFVAQIAAELKLEGLETWLCITMDASFSNWDFEKLAPTSQGSLLCCMMKMGRQINRARSLQTTGWMGGCK